MRVLGLRLAWVGCMPDSGIEMDNCAGGTTRTDKKDNGSGTMATYFVLRHRVGTPAHSVNDGRGPIFDFCNFDATRGSQPHTVTHVRLQRETERYPARCRARSTTSVSRLGQGGQWYDSLGQRQRMHGRHE